MFIKELVHKNGFFVAIAVFVVSIGIFVAQLTIATQPVAAGSAGGLPGPASGGGGGAQTSNGYGWIKVGVNSGNYPLRLRDGTPWSAVNAACSSVNARSVIAYVIYQGSGGFNNSIVYNYAGWPDTWPGHHGTDGAPWMTWQAARSDYYNTGLPYPWGTSDSNQGVGWFCYDFENNWSINGLSYIQVAANAGVAANLGRHVQGTTNAAPGNRLYWWHDLTNNGPDQMDTQILYYIAKSGFSNGWNSNLQPSGYANGDPGTTFVKVYPWAAYTVYDVQQSDVGNRLCEDIGWQRASWNNAGAAASNPACAMIPYNYTLVPQITNITNDTTIEGGVNNIPVNGLVANNGPTKSQPNIQWQLSKVTYQPGVALTNTTGGVSVNDPCTYYARSYGAKASCSPVQSGTAAGGYANGARTAYNATDNVADLQVGTQVCYVMSVKRNSSSSPDWRHSQLYCMIVAKKPKVEVLGSDLIVGSLLNGATSTPSNAVASSTVKSVNGTQKQYGSWVEYGMFVMGNVQGLASAAGYAGGVTPDPSLCKFSLLSFTNQPASGPCVDTQIGSYTSTASSPQVASRFPITSSTPKLSGNVNLDSLAAHTTYTADSGATITLNSGSAVPAGKWVVINAPAATVIIKNDITYTTATLHSLSDLPQVVIIAKNIIVNDSVKQIDSWLVAVGTGADGRLNTCGASNDGSITEATLPNAGQCNQPLQVNGPVIVNHLIMRRTAGSGIGAQSGDPAEVFNLRADAYLWATSYSPGSSRVPEASTKELPPRF